MVSSKLDGFDKIVVDPIHGDIHLKTRELEVIDTSSFQRLRHLKQLAMSQMAYPNATHTRFAHSLGALAIMSRIIEIANNTGQIKLTGKQVCTRSTMSLVHSLLHSGLIF